MDLIIFVFSLIVSYQSDFIRLQANSSLEASSASQQPK
jgi:hypothetical protein